MFKRKPAHHKRSAHSKDAADFCRITVVAIRNLHCHNNPVLPLCPGCFVKRKLDSKKYILIHFRKNFFTEGVVKHCNRLPSAVVESPSLEGFKKCVEVAFQDMA